MPTLRLFVLSLVLFAACESKAPSSSSTPRSDSLRYQGIWFTLGQYFEYGDKYSGGLGTYTAKHIPLAIYAPEVDQTFFVYGGTTGERERHLLCMIGAYDHAHKKLLPPVMVHDKDGVDDPHDNPSLAIDADGYLWVFVSGRGRKRPGFKYKSKQPYDISAFTQVSEEEMTYPQPWWTPGQGFLHLFTKYTGMRELYFETSTTGKEWSEDRQLAGIKRSTDSLSGHYQISNQRGDKVVTFFSWHPNGDVDQRTNLYYLQTTDFGKTWTDVEGNPIELPVREESSPARLVDYHSQEKNVYLKDVNFDADGNPVALYLTSGGHEPGPDNDPRQWQVIHWDGQAWQKHPVCHSDHNYDMGSLFIEGNLWWVVAPTDPGPQPFGGGGEIVLWQSEDQGAHWQRIQTLTQQSPRNHNYVRRVVGGKAPFHYFWADGNPDSLSRSVLYFGDLRGAFQAMPYGD